MPVFTQTTRADDYLAQCTAADAQALKNLIGAYLHPRAVYLGLPIPQGPNPQGQPVFARSGDGTTYPLAERVRAHGNSWGPKMMLAERLRVLAEEMISGVLSDIGGIENVRENGPWGFLLGLAERDPTTKKVIGYKGLPSNPYEQRVAANPGEPARTYIVELGVNEDMTGTVKFTPADKNASTDPL